MPYLYEITQLKPVPLLDVDVGSVVTLIDADDTLHVRVSLTPVFGGGTFLKLNEIVSVEKFSEQTMKRFALGLPAGEFKVSVGSVAGRAYDPKPGQVVLTQQGLVLAVSGMDNMGFKETQFVSMNSWEFVDHPDMAWATQDCKLLWASADMRQELITLISFQDA